MYMNIDELETSSLTWHLQLNLVFMTYFLNNNILKKNLNHNHGFNIHVDVILNALTKIT